VTIIEREATAPVEAAGVAGAGWRAVRRHFWFVLVVTAGLVLRVLAETAYQPALLYIDSVKYLEGSVATAPQGYQALLRLLDPVGGLALVAAVQHVFGLAMAVALYALLVRRGAPRWVATLAATPVLLDAYQLQLEQTIMPDVLFETMITAGLVVLLWRGPRGQRVLGGAWPVAAGALVLGAAVTVREIGAVLIVPVVVFAALTVPNWRPNWRQSMRRAALAAGCFVLPVLGYLTGTFLITGHFGMAGNGPSPQYARAAAAADCATLVVPADARALCPSPAQTLALGGVDGLLHNPRSPGHTVPVPPGLTRDEFLDRFALATFRQQPLRVAASVARDSVRLFAPVRGDDPQVTPIARWQFQDSYPTFPRRYSMAFFTRLAHAHGSGGDLVAVQPAASFLRAYQLGGGYTPGPLYAAFGVAGVLGALRRRTGLRLPCLLVTLAAVVLLVSSDAFEFSWRYQLPAVVLLPLAGMLGVTALMRAGLRGRRSRCAAPSG
jgi:Dolichyl-phosphate-mannose-protein mannosyltransferase